MGSKRLGSAGSLYYSSLLSEAIYTSFYSQSALMLRMAASLYNSRHFTCTPAVLRVRTAEILPNQVLHNLKQTKKKKEYFKRFVTTCKLFTYDSCFLQHLESGVGQHRPPEAGGLHCRRTPPTAVSCVSLK